MVRFCYVKGVGTVFLKEEHGKRKFSVIGKS